MSKKASMITLIVLCFPGSFLSFYATNLILSDIANMFYMTLTKDVISSLPIFFFAVEIAMLSISVIHFSLYSDEQQRILRINAVATAVLSFVGAVCSALSGLIIYDSFTAPYPFPGATIISLSVHALICVVSVIMATKFRPEKDVRVSFGAIVLRLVRWLLMTVFVYYAFDRFGALLWSPVYVQTSTLFKTYPFYLSLLLPVALLFHHCRYSLGFYEKSRIAGIVWPLVYLAADGILCAVNVAVGKADTQFVAAISPALGIERLLSKPVVTIAHFAVLTLPILISIVFAVTKVIRNRIRLENYCMKQ